MPAQARRISGHAKNLGLVAFGLQAFLRAMLKGPFSFLYLKKQNFKNICRIVKFSKMGACRPPNGWATGPKCKKIYI